MRCVFMYQELAKDFSKELGFELRTEGEKNLARLQMAKGQCVLGGRNTMFSPLGKNVQYDPADSEKASFPGHFKGTFSVYVDLKLFFLFTSIPPSFCYSLWSLSTYVINWFWGPLLTPVLCTNLTSPHLLRDVSGTHKMSTLCACYFCLLSASHYLVVLLVITIVSLLHLKYICLISAYFLMKNDFMSALVVVST